MSLDRSSCFYRTAVTCCDLISFHGRIAQLLNKRLLFGLKLWILWLKTTQLMLEVTFLTVETCLYKQWWVILSCGTFLLVSQTYASRLICINFLYKLLSPRLALVSGWYLIFRTKTLLLVIIIANEQAERRRSACEAAGLMPGGGDSHMKQTGMLVGNFEFNP